MAFEDSVFGAASAYSAGALTIGIPLHIEIPDSFIHVRWDSMVGKTLEDIASEKAKKDQA